MVTLRGQEKFRSLHPQSRTQPCLHCRCMTSLPAALIPVQIRGAPSSFPGLLQPVKTALMLNHQGSHKPQGRLLTPHMASCGLFGRHPHHPHRTTDGQLRKWRMWRSHWCDSGFTFCHCYNQGQAGVWPVLFRHLCMMTLEQSKTMEDSM